MTKIDKEELIIDLCAVALALLHEAQKDPDSVRSAVLRAQSDAISAVIERIKMRWE